MWIDNSNPWNLTVNDYYVTDFRSPSSYFVHDSTASYHHVKDGVYKIHHAGAPVTISRTSIGDEAVIFKLISYQTVKYHYFLYFEYVEVALKSNFYFFSIY